MTMDETRFAKLADEMLERIADAVDDALGDEIDVELQAGILTMALDGGGQYVINKHAPNRQIWMSSPVSGATHFDHVDGEWVSTRAPYGALGAMLVAELKGKFGVAVEI